MNPSLVLGIDPGTAVTGYGVVAYDGRIATLVECGVIRTTAKDPLPQRLLEIHEGIDEIIARHRPDMMSVEDVQEILAVPLIGVVPDDERVIVSTNKGEPLVLSEMPSMAGTAFDNIVRRLDGEKVPFQDLSVSNDNFFSRLRKIL